MKKIITLLILITTQSTTWASFEKIAPSSLIQNYCSISLGSEIENILISSEMTSLGSEEKKYTLFNLKIKININKKISHANIIIGCYSENKNRPSKNPAEELRQEDSGGRYYHNIAWQRNINESNWKGLIAFSDYIFGDGEKIPTYKYYIYPIGLPCFTYEIETNPTLTSKERDLAIEIIKK